jgi:hypothetical protein
MIQDKLKHRSFGEKNCPPADYDKECCSASDWEDHPRDYLARVFEICSIPSSQSKSVKMLRLRAFFLFPREDIFGKQCGNDVFAWLGVSHNLRQADADAKELAYRVVHGGQDYDRSREKLKVDQCIQRDLHCKRRSQSNSLAKPLTEAITLEDGDPKVYLLRSGLSPYYKIGCTSKPVAERVAELQTGNPVKLTVVDTVDVHDGTCSGFLAELAAHARFREHGGPLNPMERTKWFGSDPEGLEPSGATEWFEFTDAQVKEVKEYMGAAQFKNRQTWEAVRDELKA